MINLRCDSCKLLFLKVLDIARYSMFTQNEIILLISISFRFLDLSIWMSSLKMTDLIISLGICGETSTRLAKVDWSESSKKNSFVLSS